MKAKRGATSILTSTRDFKLVWGASEDGDGDGEDVVDAVVLAEATVPDAADVMLAALELPELEVGLAEALECADEEGGDVPLP